MRTVRTVVNRSGGQAHFIPVWRLWAVSGALVDTFPLDRARVRGPRVARRAATCARLLFVDRPVQNPEGTAMATLSDTPWIPAIAVALLAAFVVPRLPRWVRRGVFAALAVWIVTGRRGPRYVTLRRQLRAHARHGVLISDFLAREPGAGMRWVTQAAEAIGPGFQFVVLVPESGDARRDAARERLYVRQLGFRRVAEATAGGQKVAILVRG